MERIKPMGLFLKDEPIQEDGTRMQGFARYRELIERDHTRFLKAGLLTVLGFLPFAAGAVYSVLSSSFLLLLASSLIGGVIAGPFYACMQDIVYRSLRDDNRRFSDDYRKAMKQNFSGAILPGCLLTLMIGIYSFMGVMMFYWAKALPSVSVIVLYLLGCYIFILLHTVIWPQLVLFRQPLTQSLRNALLFLARYLWKIMGLALIQMGFWAVIILFLPWSLILIPFPGVWFITFLTNFLMYNQMDEVFHIEESIQAARQ